MRGKGTSLQACTKEGCFQTWIDRQFGHELYPGPSMGQQQAKDMAAAEAGVEFFGPTDTFRHNGFFTGGAGRFYTPHCIRLSGAGSQEPPGPHSTGSKGSLGWIQ
jgi:hypothetical protein